MERPIIFSAPMVRAILECRKVQTRRVMKPQPKNIVLKESRYQVGARLWVKETWQTTDEAISEEPGVVYRATDPDWESMEGWKWRPSIFMPRWASRLTLEITDVRVQRIQDISGQDCYFEGCVPDWEEFEDATCYQEEWEEPEEFNEECEEECDWINFGRNLVHSGEHKKWKHDRLNYALRLAYRSLWDSLNEESGFGWETNPWVWAITFKVLR